MFCVDLSSLLGPSGLRSVILTAGTRYFRRRVQGLHSGTRGLVRPFKFTAKVATHVRDAASVVARVLQVHVVQSSRGLLPNGVL